MTMEKFTVQVKVLKMRDISSFTSGKVIKIRNILLWSEIKTTFYDYRHILLKRSVHKKTKEIF